MRIFLDRSVLIAACGSAHGASREIFTRAAANEWGLVSTRYVISELTVNLPKLGVPAAEQWDTLRGSLELVEDIFTLELPSVFGPAKDRPILFSALAWADVLLTLDRGDFGAMLGKTFYGLRVMTPGAFLEAERRAGRWR